MDIVPTQHFVLRTSYFHPSCRYVDLIARTGLTASKVRADKYRETVDASGFTVRIPLAKKFELESEARG